LRESGVLHVLTHVVDVVDVLDEMYPTAARCSEFLDNFTANMHLPFRFSEHGSSSPSDEAPKAELTEL
jgi:hypothetical protein